MLGARRAGRGGAGPTGGACSCPAALACYSQHTQRDAARSLHPLHVGVPASPASISRPASTCPSTGRNSAIPSLLPRPAPAQVRGSIPVLWSQTPNLKYKIPIRIAAPGKADGPFAAHVRNLVEAYKVGGGREGRGD